MKKMITLVALTLLVTSLAFAGSVTGYVTDLKCAKADKAGAGHAGCAKGCIGGGEPAVVVTEDGKIYEVAEQDKVTGHAGAKVTVMGTIDGMKITKVESVKAEG
ncbi:MAG: hypothetical protein OXN89_15640 [Bryobacterales bacterium]|nr:hypothetical protein [Bryobacterales bacterium]